MDLDILWAEGRATASAELVVPHVELSRRAFALLPLVELCPDAEVPGSRLAYRTFLADVRSQRIELWQGQDWWKGP